ncbi:hypothetical protein BC831DRAFT_452613, partial [Entophlyctis helioformis]
MQHLADQQVSQMASDKSLACCRWKACDRCIQPALRALSMSADPCLAARSLLPSLSRPPICCRATCRVRVGDALASDASFHVSIGASWSTVRHALANPDNVPPAGMAGCEGGRMQAGWRAWRRCGRADRVRARHRLQTQTHNRSAPDCAHCCCALVVAAL